VVQHNTPEQGCQMVCLNTKHPNFGTFGRPGVGQFSYILWPLGVFSGYLVYLMAVRLFGVLCGHLVLFVVIGYIWVLVYCTRKKSGNPAPESLGEWFVLESVFQFLNFSHIFGTETPKETPKLF
jgi:hypothetical protein